MMLDNQIFEDWLDPSQKTIEKIGNDKAVASKHFSKFSKKQQKTAKNSKTL